MTAPSRFPGPRRAVSLACLLAVLIAPAAHGADKKPAPTPAPKTPLLTQEQLRDCLAQKEKLAKETDAAVKSKAAVAAQKEGIESGAKALESEATTLDRTSDEAIAAYNAKVIEHKAKVDAYRAGAEAYNVEAERVIGSRDAYDKACVNRRFDERDLSDVQKKK